MSVLTLNAVLSVLYLNYKQCFPMIGVSLSAYPNYGVLHVFQANTKLPYVDPLVFSSKYTGIRNVAGIYLLLTLLCTT